MAEPIVKLFPPLASPAIPDVPYQTPLQNVNAVLSHVALNNGLVRENFFKMYQYRAVSQKWHKI